MLQSVCFFKNVLTFFAFCMGVCARFWREGETPPLQGMSEILKSPVGEDITLPKKNVRTLWEDAILPYVGLCVILAGGGKPLPYKG